MLNSMSFQQASAEGRYDAVAAAADHSVLAEKIAVQELEIHEGAAARCAAEDARALAEREVEEKREVISTLELSVEEHAKKCAELSAENGALKLRERDYKNQMISQRGHGEILVNKNAKLVLELSEARKELDSSAQQIVQLKKDLRSYELLAKAEPTAMYAEVRECCEIGRKHCWRHRCSLWKNFTHHYRRPFSLFLSLSRGRRQIMAKSRIGLEDDNRKLRDRLYMMTAKAKDDADEEEKASEFEDESKLSEEYNAGPSTTPPSLAVEASSDSQASLDSHLKYLQLRAERATEELAEEEVAEAEAGGRSLAEGSLSESDSGSDSSMSTISTDPRELLHEAHLRAASFSEPATERAITGEENDDDDDDNNNDEKEAKQQPQEEGDDDE